MKAKTKRCFICQKEIPVENGEVCPECKDFFKWKYKATYQEILDIHKELQSLERKLRSIKSRRKE